MLAEKRPAGGWACMVLTAVYCQKLVLGLLSSKTASLASRFYSSILYVGQIFLVENYIRDFLPKDVQLGGVPVHSGSWRQEYRGNNKICRI